MGKENDVILDYLDVNEHFADLYNGSYFGGKKVVDAEELAEAAGVYWDAEMEKGCSDGRPDRRTRTSERRRDLKKRLKSGNWLCVLAIEHQSGVDCTMAWRHMYYDALEYKKQIKEIETQNEKCAQGQEGKRWKNIFTENDKLIPIFTLCLYLGEEPWTGPRSLSDMMQFGEDGECWKELFADYRMNLICVNEMTDFSNYHTPLKLLLLLLANRGSKKKMKKLIRDNPEFRKVNKATARAAGILLGVEVEMEKRIAQEGEEIDMCTGLKEWFREEREEGREEGRSEGREDINRLILKLAEAGRLDDMVRAAADSDYQNQLLQEYSLV